MGKSSFFKKRSGKGMIRVSICFQLSGHLLVSGYSDRRLVSSRITTQHFLPVLFFSITGWFLLFLLFKKIRNLLVWLKFSLFLCMLTALRLVRRARSTGPLTCSFKGCSAEMKEDTVLKLLFLQHSQKLVPEWKKRDLG